MNNLFTPIFCVFFLNFGSANAMPVKFQFLGDTIEYVNPTSFSTGSPTLGVPVLFEYTIDNDAQDVFDGHLEFGPYILSDSDGLQYSFGEPLDASGNPDSRSTDYTFRYGVEFEHEGIVEFQGNQSNVQFSLGYNLPETVPYEISSVPSTGESLAFPLFNQTPTTLETATRRETELVDGLGNRQYFSFVDGFAFFQWGDPTIGTDDFDFVNMRFHTLNVTPIAAVPLPATGILYGLALLGLGFTRSRIFSA